jgi:hypothetical protein
MNNLNLQLGPMLFSGSFFVHNQAAQHRSYRVKDELGRIVWSWMLAPGTYRGVDTSSWTDGLYTMYAEGEEDSARVLRKG